MQQQYHTCNSNITHATAAISRMQQQQYHTCNSSDITHATAVSRMQQQYHVVFTHATSRKRRVSMAKLVTVSSHKTKCEM